MIFYLHYIMLTGGLCGTSVLLGVYFKQYSDASQSEIGALLMTFPFVAIIIKPLFCSLADRYQAHKAYLIGSLIVLVLGYTPFAVIPFFPDFYEQMPRLSWYLLVIACHIGNAGLGVAWSLGDSLAINKAQKTDTPYGRMRLTGTVSWGVFGYVIGEINETPMLPKYLPAFLVLITNALLEIVLLIFWSDADFEMCDPIQQQQQQQQQQPNPKEDTQQQQQQPGASADGNNVITLPQLAALSCKNPADLVDSTPSSLGGTLRLNSKTAMAMKSVIVPDDLASRLRSLEHATNAVKSETTGATVSSSSLPVGDSFVSPAKDAASINGSLSRQIFGRLNLSYSQDESSSLPNQTKSPTSIVSLDYMEDNNNIKDPSAQSQQLESAGKNPQLILLRFILTKDGRLVKYLVVFTMFGLLIAPMNFVFLSMVEVCKEKGYNFSQLAGSVLISQASVETLGFLVLPWFLNRVNRFVLMAFGLAILLARYLFYATIYYTADISPYWALVGEWGHGLSYSIFCLIMADVALIFASESRLFINELRALGFLSDPAKVSGEKIRMEENAIRIALRATMQALFGGFMDGLGQGSGSLLCGLLAEAYSYITLWKLFAILSVLTLVAHQFVELTGSKWSDLYKPRKGSKAYEIMQYCGHTKSLSSEQKRQQQQRQDSKDCLEKEISSATKSKFCLVRLAHERSSEAAKPC